MPVLNGVPPASLKGETEKKADMCAISSKELEALFVHRFFLTSANVNEEALNALL